MQKPAHFFLTLFAVFLIFFIWSAVNPLDRLTWFLELAPTLIALPVLFLSYKKVSTHTITLQFDFSACHYSRYRWSLDLCRSSCI